MDSGSHKASFQCTLPQESDELHCSKPYANNKELNQKAKSLNCKRIRAHLSSKLKMKQFTTSKMGNAIYPHKPHCNTFGETSRP